MSYNDIIDRSAPGGGALVPPEHSNDIVKSIESQSAALRYFKRMPIMTNAKSIPVLSQRPTAFWITDSYSGDQDTGLIQTSDMAWKKVTMNVCDMGVIVPFPRRLAADVAAGGVNLTEEIRPAIAAAMARKIDAAIFFGIDKPADWPTAVVPAATAAGNVREIAATAAQGGLHSDITHLLKTVREDGFSCNAAIGRAGFEFDLLDSRDTTGHPLFTPQTLTPGVGDTIRGTLMGRDVLFATDGVFPAATQDADPQLVVFDSTKHIIGLREELVMSVHTDGVIQNQSGTVQYNLMQQDMISLRFIMRIGYAVANPVTVAQPTEANRYPGGVLTTPTE